MLEETNLYVLNSGTTPPNPLELLASDKFKRTLDTLKERFSYIVIDSAPVLPASDAIVLGKMADALLARCTVGPDYPPHGARSPQSGLVPVRSWLRG